MQRAYGTQLSPKLRNSILAVLNGYLAQDKAEADAPYLRDALATIEQIKGSIDALAQFIYAISDPAGKYVLAVLNTRFAQRGRLLSLLAAKSVACEEARKQLRHDAEKSGFKEGQAWRWMVGRLFDLAAKAKLPVTVSKPNSRQKSEFRPSPFVKFVESLQKELPPVKWKPPQKGGALAAAISSVKLAAKRAKTKKIGAICPRKNGGR